MEPDGGALPLLAASSHVALSENLCSTAGIQATVPKVKAATSQLGKRSVGSHHDHSDRTNREGPSTNRLSKLLQRAADTLLHLRDQGRGEEHHAQRLAQASTRALEALGRVGAPMPVRVRGLLQRLQARALVGPVN